MPLLRLLYNQLTSLLGRNIARALPDHETVSGRVRIDWARWGIAIRLFIRSKYVRARIYTLRNNEHTSIWRQKKYLNKVEGFKKITKLDRNWRKDLNADFKYPSSYKIIATAIISTIHTTLIATIIDMIIGYGQIERNDIIGYCCKKLGCISHWNRNRNWIIFIHSLKNKKLDQSNGLLEQLKW